MTTTQPAGATEAAAAEVAAALLPTWLQFPGHRVIAALLVVALGVSLSKVLVSLLGRPIARRFERQSVAQIVLGGVRATTIAVTLIIAGSLVGLQIGNIVLSVTVFSAVVGIILAPIVGNVLNGIFVLADQPFEIGDMIELDDGTRGFVDDITIRYTKVFTLDNTFLVIPNGNVRDRDVTNYSAEDERTRLSLDVLVTYESDIPEARRQMELAARDTDDVINGGPDIRVGSARYPATPNCFIADFADSGVLLRLRYWVTKPIRSLLSNLRFEPRSASGSSTPRPPLRWLTPTGNSSMLIAHELIRLRAAPRSRRQPSQPPQLVTTPLRIHRLTTANPRVTIPFARLRIGMVRPIQPWFEAH